MTSPSATTGWGPPRSPVQGWGPPPGGLGWNFMALFHGHGGLSATAVVGQASASPHFAGHGALTASVVAKKNAAPAFAGHGALSATAVHASIPANFTGHGVLSLVTSQHANSTAAFAGHGALSLTDKPKLGAAFHGSGVLSPNVLAIAKVPLALSGHGAFTPVAKPGAARSAALSGHGALSVTASSGPKYDAIGAGSTTTSAASSISWNHTATGGALVIVAVVVNGAVSKLGSVTYGSTSMVQLSYDTDSAGNTLAYYGLNGVASGSKTVTVSTSSGTALMEGNSISVVNVQSMYGPFTASDGGTASTSLSQTVSCSGNQMIVQSFESLGSADITAYSGGSGRYLGLYGGTSGRGVLSFSTATSSTTFTATSSASADWAGLALVLSPSTAAVTAGFTGNGALPLTATSGPKFDAVGGGSQFGGSTSASWSHNATAGATVIVAIGSEMSNPSNISVSYGGTSMTSIGSIAYDNGGTPGYVQFFSLSGVASGSKTVTVTDTSFGSLGGGACSVSFTNVNSVGSLQTNYGSSTAPSQSISCSAGQIIVCGIGDGAPFSTTPTGGTNRYYLALDTGVGSYGFAINTATSTTTFSGSTSHTAGWATAGVVLS